MPTDLRIVFMGTPEFAVASLDALVEGGYNVVGVVTMPDKPAGRGHRLQCSAVKQYALQHGLPLLQPERLRDEAFLEALRALRADLQVVVAFRMLPEVVWNMPPRGTFNLHASLLPQYRGAAPINWALINGDQETGLTTFFLDHEIDTGRVVFQEREPILEMDDAGVLHDRLMARGGELVTRTVDAVAGGMALARDQKDLVPSSELLRPAPKIFRQTCMIRWSRTGSEIRNHVRGLSPYPCALAVLENGNSEPVTVKVYSVRVLDVPAPAGAIPGSILTDGRTFLRVVTGSGGLVGVEQMQLPGKRSLPVAELLRGFRLAPDARFLDVPPQT